MKATRYFPKRQAYRLVQKTILMEIYEIQRKNLAVACQPLPETFDHCATGLRRSGSLPEAVTAWQP